MAAIQTIYRNALKPGQSLNNYQVLEVLGQGSFGITYLCEDRQNGRLVAIKEYLPGQYAQREADDNLLPLSDDHEEEFVRGLARFISEAAHLDRFVHPNIVRVLDVFQANNTAYLVMNYEQGESLHAILSQRGKLSEQELQAVLFPVLDGLEAMHNQGLIHRDIKPSNIFIRDDGSPVLLDFGSARLAMMERLSQTLTNIVTPGYAPIEQYATKREKQGPWTDIYGLGATLYKVVTGVPPIEAVARAESILHDGRDPYVSAAKRSADGYSTALLLAIDSALRFRAQARPQSIAEWREHFLGKASNDSYAEEDPPTERAHHQASVVADLVANLKPEPVEAAPEAATNKVQPGSARRRMKPAAGLFLATNMIVVAAAAFVAPNTGRDSISRPPEVLERLPTADAAPTTGTVPAGISAAELELPALSSRIAEVDQATAASATAHTERPNAAPAVENAERTGVDRNTAKPRKADNEPARSSGNSEQKAVVEKDASKQKASVENLLKLAAAEVTGLTAANSTQVDPVARYREVLHLDPNNRSAHAGLLGAANKYVDLVFADLDANDLLQARTHLRLAAAINPNNERVKSARAAVRAKRAELALKSDQTGINPGGAAGEFVPDLARHTPPASLSRFDELRRRMAGERIP